MLCPTLIVLIGLFLLLVQIAQVIFVKVALPLASVARFCQSNTLLNFLFAKHDFDIIHVKVAIPVLVKTSQNRRIRNRIETPHSQ